MLYVNSYINIGANNLITQLESFDSWGKLISIDGTSKDSVGIKNPYRYRGYRYDSETGLYYLQSRYYNSDMGRFINADHVSILEGQIGQQIGANLFAYCRNNPIMLTDPSGQFVIEDIAWAILKGTLLYAFRLAAQYWYMRPWYAWYYHWNFYDWAFSIVWSLPFTCFAPAFIKWFVAYFKPIGWCGPALKTITYSTALYASYWIARMLNWIRR